MSPGIIIFEYATAIEGLSESASPSFDLFNTLATGNKLVIYWYNILD